MIQREDGPVHPWTDEAEALYTVLKAWFEAHYEDPVKHCPYIEDQGGYQYMWGGPYKVEDVLQKTWGGFFRDNGFLEDVADRLCDETDCFEWSAVPEEF